MPRASATRRTLTASDVWLSFFCLYLLTASRSVPFGDATPMWDAAVNLLRHGTFAIDVRWPINAPLGRNGHYYPVAALLACLVHVPGALLQLALAALAPERAAQFVAVTSQLAPLVLGALTPALFFRLLGQLGYDRRQVAWATLLLGVGTSIWVYAHRPYSEVLQATCFVAFLAALLRAGEDVTRGSFLRLGFALALLVNSKNVYFVCVPGALVYLCVRRRGRLRELAPGLVWAGAGLAPGLVALAVYNYVRWGSVLSSGYDAVTSGFWNHNVLWGLWGQLLSPGKSIFLFSPPLVLALFGIRRLVARRPHVALAIALTVGPIAILYSRYLFWSGDWGWGARYLVFALPALLLPVAELFGGDSPPRRSLRAGLAAVLVTGIAVQGLGNALGWDDFMGIARQAQQTWLGKPDKRGTVLRPDPCYSCFEEVFAIQWLPPLQPILGQWWLLRHKIAGDDWKVAEADAPWKRYTSLTLDIKGPYELAAIDWWPFATVPGRRAATVALITLLLGLATPLRLWRAALRAGDDPPPTNT